MKVSALNPIRDILKHGTTIPLLFTMVCSHTPCLHSSYELSISIIWWSGIVIVMKLCIFFFNFSWIYKKGRYYSFVHHWCFCWLYVKKVRVNHLHSIHLLNSVCSYIIVIMKEGKLLYPCIKWRNIGVKSFPGWVHSTPFHLSYTTAKVWVVV